MIRKTVSILAILAIILAVPAISHAAGNVDAVTSPTKPVAEPTTQLNTGLSSFSTNQPYTLEEMLTYTILDEYALHTLYTSAVNSQGAAEPFRHLLEDETDLINQLTQLLTDYRVVLPNLAAVLVPQTFVSLREATLAGIKAERLSIEMYQAFLAKDFLTEDVRELFQHLLDASVIHLDILTEKAGIEGWLQSTQDQNDRNDDEDEDDDKDDD